TDQVLARLRQNNDGHVVRDALVIHQLANEVEVGLRGRREADFDFLEADLHELVEEAQLALHAHGLDQRLVAVAQVGRHPDGRASNAFAWPGPFGEVALEGHEGTVFFSRIRDHDAPGYSKRGIGGCVRRQHAWGDGGTESGRNRAAELPQDARSGNRSVVEAKGKVETCEQPLRCPRDAAQPRPDGRWWHGWGLRAQNS